MTLQEQQVFEETRNRIQHNLAEIGALARTNASPASFFGKFLELACDCLNASGGAVWLCESEGMRRIAECRFNSSEYETDPSQKQWIEAVLAVTASSRRPHIVAADDPSVTAREVPEGGVGNTVPRPFFYHPVVLGDRTAAILQIWLAEAGDQRTYNDITTFVAQLGGHAESYLRGWQGAQFAARNEQAQAMLRLQGELVGELDVKVLYSSAANYLLDLMRADVACVFCRKGRRWTLVSASNQEAVDARSVHSQALSRVADALPSAPGGSVVETEAAEGDLRDALDAADVRRICWSHISSSKNAGHDVLLLAAKNEDGQFPANARELVGWTGGQLARALDSATHFHHIPLRPLASLAGRTIRAWNQHRRKKVVAWAVAPVLLAAAVLAFPVTWKIPAECTVMPFRKAIIVAETSGKIVGVDVGEGDLVAAGQLLARLDDTDYAMQIAVAHQQLLRWQVEAGKAQTLGTEAERKIAELGAARETEAIRRLEFLRSRTRLVSPISGMVLTRNLRNREGEAIETGRPFCEIGGLGDYELLLDIRQNDLGDLLAALDAGRRLPVGFILHPHPHIALEATLAGSGQVSQVPELKKAGSVFIARVPFPKDSPLEDLLKPGFTGKAKIAMGSRPLGWVIFRPFLNYLRVNWGL